MLAVAATARPAAVGAGEPGPMAKQNRQKTQRRAKGSHLREAGAQGQALYPKLEPTTLNTQRRQQELERIAFRGSWCESQTPVSRRGCSAECELAGTGTGSTFWPNCALQT